MLATKTTSSLNRSTLSQSKIDAQSYIETFKKNCTLKQRNTLVASMAMPMDRYRQFSSDGQQTFTDMMAKNIYINATTKSYKHAESSNDRLPMRLEEMTVAEGEYSQRSTGASTATRQRRRRTIPSHSFMTTHSYSSIQPINDRLPVAGC